MQTDLSALIERVESGNGSDRELDADIFIALSPEIQAAGRIDKLGGVVGWWPKNGPYQSARETARLTSSLDAVISLIEAKLPWWGWDIATGGGFTEAGVHNAQKVEWNGESASPARALLAAALRAMLSAAGERV